MVVGSGFTGLQAALALARGGRQPIVLDAEALGHGASTRNNGAVIPYLYKKYDLLERKYGTERATALAGGGLDAVRYFVDFVRDEQIECGLVENDRYFFALTAAHFDRLAHNADLYQRSGVDTGWQTLSATAMREETGLSGFHGGVCARASLTIHPGLYHAGLLDRVQRAGVSLFDHSAVTGINPRPDAGYEIDVAAPPTSGGQPRRLRCNDVVVATNGYADAAAPWARRRLMPVRLHMAVTEPIPDEIRARVFPTPRVLVNSKTNITWARLTPDGTRVITGGCAGMDSEDSRANAEILHRNMARFIPALAPLSITHCWSGLMGFPFDQLPHTGSHAGVHYALGFCGAGVAMGSWLGHQLAGKILGAAGAETPFDDREFPAMPFYRGETWPVSLAMSWINLRDAWETRSAASRSPRPDVRP